MRVKLKSLIKPIVAFAMIGLYTSNVLASDKIHNFANFNIRYVNSANGDTGEKHWSSRGEYVVRIIKDYDFDILGMEEVTGRNSGKSINPTTGRSQLEDLKAWMPEYSFLEWERSGNNNVRDYSYNVIAYKKSKYEVLESGCFWLSPTPDTPGPGWDPNEEYSGIWRTCGWARMKDCSTGELFVFAVLHANYGASLDGINSGRLVSKRLDAIADELPLVLVGDFNMRRDGHEAAYRGYAASLYDAALTAKENYCLPVTNPSTTITSQNWYPVNNSQMSGAEFDYCFYRNMDVHSRHIITEYYGRSVNPSDHFPILMKCSLRQPMGPMTVYVDPEAVNGGNGTKEHPFNTLAAGVTAAEMNGTVKLAVGTLHECVSLPFSVNIEGGYDRQFTSIIGKTVIDGDVNGDDESGNTADNLANLISVPHYYSLTMSNTVLCNAVSKVIATDGALLFNGFNLNLDRVEFRNNKAYSTGGGISASCADISMSGCIFEGNTATECGGGASLTAVGKIMLTDIVCTANTSKVGAAIAISDAEYVNLSGSTFCNNTVARNGTLYFKQCPSGNTYNVTNCTFANNILASPSGVAGVTRKFGGAAVQADFTGNATLNVAHVTIVGNNSTFAGSNKANFGGSAFNISGGSVRVQNSIIAGNYSDNGIGDMVIDASTTILKEQYNVLSCRDNVNFGESDKDFLASDFSSCVAELPSLLEGVAENGRFKASLKDNGGSTTTVKPVGTSYAGKDVNVLSSFLRMIEASFSYDLNGDGQISGVFDKDQCGHTRLAMSMPGAVEYIENSGTDDIIHGPGSMVTIESVGKGLYKVMCDISSHPICVYASNGTMVKTINAHGFETIVDLSYLPHGIYILKYGYATYKIAL